jgi:hypothetical protein
MAIVPAQGGDAVTDKRDKPDTNAIDWHSAFRDVIQLALYQYRDDLSFEFEHPLNSEPLRIDMVIEAFPKLQFLGKLPWI